MNRLRFTTFFLLGTLAACTGARATELDDPSTSNMDPTEPTEEESGEPGTTSQDKAGGKGNGNKTPSGACAFHDSIDHDGDGLSFAAGDCDDCDPNVHPSRIDVPGNNKDDDCSGKADDDVACDNAIPISSSDARDAAKALGLCKNADPAKQGWGVVSARYIKPDGTTLGDAMSWGILESFGANEPRHGGALVALSTGVARAPGMPGYKSPSGQSKGYTHPLPHGFPKAAPA